MKFTPAVENFAHVTLTTVEQAKLRMTETLRDGVKRCTSTEFQDCGVQRRAIQFQRRV